MTALGNRKVLLLWLLGVGVGGLHCRKACPDLPPKPEIPPDLVLLVPPDTSRNLNPLFPRVKGSALFYLMGTVVTGFSCGREVWQRDLQSGESRMLWDFGDSLCVTGFDVRLTAEESLLVASVEDPYPQPYLLLVNLRTRKQDTLSWGCRSPLLDPQFRDDGRVIFASMLPWWEDSLCPYGPWGVWAYDRAQDTAWHVLDLPYADFFVYRGYVVEGDSVWSPPEGSFPALDPWEGRKVVADEAGLEPCAMSGRLLVWDRVDSTQVEVEIPWPGVVVPRHPDWADVPGHGRGIVFWVTWGCPMPDKAPLFFTRPGDCPSRHLWFFPPGIWMLKNWTDHAVP